MADPLAGARLKLVRAEERLTELRDSHHAFLQRNPYRALRESDTDPHHFLWRVKVVEEPPLTAWGAVIGDFVHALRSSLDHAAYALVNREHLVSEAASFPILKNPDSWESAHPKELPGVAPEVLAEIEGLQPYHGGELPDLLGLIHDLDIVEKHRRIPIVSSMLFDSGWNINVGEIRVSDPGIGPFEDGAVIGSFSIHTDEDADVSMQIAFAIAFGEGVPVVEGQEVERVMEYWRVTIGGIVSRFGRFF